MHSSGVLVPKIKKLRLTAVMLYYRLPSVIIVVVALMITSKTVLKLAILRTLEWYKVYVEEMHLLGKIDKILCGYH